MERKRASKAKRKSDFDVVCTGPGSSALPSGNVSADGGGDDLASSVGSAASAHVDSLVDKKLEGFSKSFRAQVDKDWQVRINQFMDSFVAKMNAKVDSLREEIFYEEDSSQDVTVNDPSLSAPQEVSGQPTLVTGQPSLSRSAPPDDIIYQGTANKKPMPPGTSDDSWSPIVAKKRQFDALLHEGFISKSQYSDMLARLSSVMTGSGSVDQSQDQPGPSGSASDSAGFPSSLTTGRREGPGAEETEAGGSGLPVRARSTRGGLVLDNDDVDDDVNPNVEFRELYDFVTSIFPEANPPQTKSPPRSFLKDQPCLPETGSAPRFALYDRFGRIRGDLASNLAEQAKEIKKPSTVLARRRPTYKVSVNPLAAAPILNDSFGRMCTTKPSSNADTLVPLEEVRRLEASLIGLQEAQSFSAWLLSALIKHVKDSNFVSPQPAIFNRLASSLSLALNDQSTLTHSMSAFCSVTRRSHFLKFATALTEGQRARLLGSDPFQKDLFDPAVLEQVLSEFERTSATNSHLDVSQAVSKGLFFGKRPRDPSPAVSPPVSSVSPVVPPGGEAPPLDYSSRGRGKRRRVFRGRGRGNKRGRGGSNFSKPSSSEKGFQK